MKMQGCRPVAGTGGMAGVLSALLRMRRPPVPKRASALQQYSTPPLLLNDPPMQFLLQPCSAVVASEADLVALPLAHAVDGQPARSKEEGHLRQQARACGREQQVGQAQGCVCVQLSVLR